MAKSSNPISRTFVWILMGLLFVGLAGFGATNLSGTVRAIGTVGDKAISVDDYFRGVQGELRALSAQAGQAISFRDAQAAGVIDGVVSQLVTVAALDHEASELGISISDERLGQEILGLPAFRGIDGTFDREAYGLSLRQNGFSEAEFEEDLREETARTLLQAAVVTGNPMPDIYAQTLLNYAAETRDFTFARLAAQENAEAAIVDPTASDLERFHSENTDRYTVPETRRITYISLTPDMILDTVQVDQAALEAEYQANIEQYVQPERRLVERLVMPDQAAAETALASIAAGQTTFEDVVAERGLTLTDIDMGDMSRDALGAAGDAVFDGQEGDVVGPFASSLGPAIFRINGVLPALETSLEDATPFLREALAQDRARRAIEALAQEFDDLLAGGATLEELADETDAQLGTIGWTPASDEGIAAYDRFRAAAQRVSESDFPEIDDLGDGGLFALRLDAVEAPRAQTLNEVRDIVEADWRAAEAQGALMAQAEELADQIASGERFSALGLDPQGRQSQSRGGLLIDLPAGAMETVFDMASGETRALAGDDGSAIVLRLDAILAPDLADQDTQAVSDFLAEQGRAGLAGDLFDALARDIQARAGLQIDQQAINAVNVNFQ